MGNRVASFFDDLGNGLKMLWSETQDQYIRPVLGDNLADRLGIKKNRGDPWKDQIGTLILAKGGTVSPPMVINNKADLIKLIRDFPEEAAANNLTIDLVNQYAYGGIFHQTLNDKIF